MILGWIRAFGQKVLAFVDFCHRTLRRTASPLAHVMQRKRRGLGLQYAARRENHRVPIIRGGKDG